MVLGNVLQGMSGTLNGIFVGQMLGTQALAATAGMFPIVFFLVSLVIGVGAGASILIGQAWGAGELHKVRHIAGNAILAGLVVGVCAAWLGSAFAAPALRALHTPPEVLADAVLYARTLMLAMPGLLLFILFSQLLRGVGDTFSPMVAMLLSTALSCVLTPALIRGWAGLPQLGLVSAAAATVASYVAALGWLAWHLRRRRHPLALDAQLLRQMRPHGPTLRLMLRIGMPAGVQMIVVSLAEIVLLALVNGHGPDAVAAYGAVNQIVNYVQFPAMSIAITASILCAQAIGAGRAERLGAITRTALGLNLVVTGGLVLLGYGFSERLLALFITRPDVIALAQSLLHILLWSLLLHGWASVLGGVMRASGTVMVPMLLSVACIACVELPAAYALSAAVGLRGVWMSYPITFAAMLVLNAAYFQLVWRRRRIARLV
ncbi:MATE family efflux transporter [Pseudorhodoferax sp.]|uniref:MATE family efflux transporter n=1 Tax=Pseudorhodoferax sp. TaxID=1993553 RepID=UPI0039E21638